MNRTIGSVLQSVAVIAVCALLGYSLSRFPGAETVPWWLPTSIGAAIGTLAFAISPLFGGLAQRTERDSSPNMKLGFKLMFIGGVICVGGFLLSVFLPSILGSIILFCGWVVGVVGIVLFRVARHAA